MQSRGCHVQSRGLCQEGDLVETAESETFVQSTRIDFIKRVS